MILEEWRLRIKAAGEMSNVNRIPVYVSVIAGVFSTVQYTVYSTVISVFVPFQFSRLQK